MESEAPPNRIVHARAGLGRRSGRSRRQQEKDLSRLGAILTAVTVAAAAGLAGCRSGPSANKEYHALEVKYVEAAGVRLAYVEAGEGPPLVMLHGIMSSKYAWRKNIMPLARYYHVIAIDSPGAGDSEKPPNIDYSPEGLARIHLRALDALGIRRATIVGNSLGGAVALAMARDHPERVDKLVLVSPAGYPTATLNLPVETAPILGEFLTPFYGDPVVALTWRDAVYNYDKVLDEDRLEMARPMRSGAGKNALLKKLRAVQGDYFERFSKTIPKISTPAFIIWGYNDQILPVEHAFRYMRDMPKAWLMIVPESGHRTQSEWPEIFNSAVVDFLLNGQRSTGGDKPRAAVRQTPH